MKRIRWRRVLMGVVKILALAYFGLLVLVFIFQRSFIYHPSRVSHSVLDLAAHHRGFEVWTNASGLPIGWKRLSSAKSPAGQLLIFHGNGGNATHVLSLANELLHEEPWDIYSLEYPGYGSREGSPSEANCFAAAREGFELIAKNGSVNGSVYVLGISLGTGVATWLAAEFPHDVKGLLLVAPYDNLVSVGKVRMPFFPVSLMQWDRFTSDRYLQNYQGSVAMMFAGRDYVVPNRLGHRLYDGYQGTKKFWNFPEAGHNGLLPQPPAWWRELLLFWRGQETKPSVLPIPH